MNRKNSRPGSRRRGVAPTPRSAIDETAFASSGDIVVVHADGYLESFVPKEVIAAEERRRARTVAST